MYRALIVGCAGLALAVCPISFQTTANGQLVVLTAQAAKGGGGGGRGGGGDHGGGNGGGNGGNGGGVGAGGTAKGDSGGSGKASAPGQAKQDGSPATGKAIGKVGSGSLQASAFGKLNGFMHASPTALAKASVKSPLGMIASTYAGQLGAYLSVDQTKATSEQIEAAKEKLEAASLTLAGAANKPLSPDVVNAVNTRIGDLAKSNSLPGTDPGVTAALSGLSSGDAAQQSRNQALSANIAQMAATSTSSAE